VRHHNGHGALAKALRLTNLDTIIRFKVCFNTAEKAPAAVNG
jgi:hypothetical protein